MANMKMSRRATLALAIVSRHRQKSACCWDGTTDEIGLGPMIDLSAFSTGS
jgi:hypothetical protein